MVSDKMFKELNDQVHAELNSEYIYLAMAAWLDKEGLEGFAHFFKVQASEEREHAMKFYDYIYDVGGCVTLKAFDQPKAEYGSAVEVFEDALAHERYITGRINTLVKIAREENDYKTEDFLGWFLKEQIEEEANMIKGLDKTTAFSANKGQLFMLDAQMAKRE